MKNRIEFLFFFFLSKTKISGYASFYSPRNIKKDAVLKKNESFSAMKI